ncbi:MAG: TIGR00730 family Rossman fold protein [Phycisphaerae bacterium]|nr:TIGR00730 family Rossman fold protein [Phycisphaerae bacterium]
MPADGGIWPQKAYKNLRFLTSPDARPIRVLCELMEPAARFAHHDVRATIVFFGSTRIVSRRQADERLAAADAADDDAAIAAARHAVAMSRYYEDARELARRLTAWARTRDDGGGRFTICSGGGPGIMEAANRGASDAGGPSVGLNISLPNEQVPNGYQTPELSFEFHYFFMRKFWFAYLARALVVFPGGFGTLDELFEVLTLAQTHKTAPRPPVLVYGSEFWNDVVDINALSDRGMIDAADRELFRSCDDVDEAFAFLTDALTAGDAGDG